MIAWSLFVATLVPGPQRPSECVSLIVTTSSVVAPREQQDLTLRLRLVNHCRSSILLSPVIGDLVASLTVYAQPTAGEPRVDADPIPVFARDSHLGAHETLDDHDLFKLHPGRQLGRELTLSLTQVVKAEGAFDLWVELDTRGMRRYSKKAFAGLLVSNRFPVTVRASQGSP